MNRRNIGIGATVAGTVLTCVAAPATAAAPERFTVYRNEPMTFSIDCGDFVASGEGVYSERWIFFLDSEGNVTRFAEYVSAPADVWTNSQTGASITVRGHFEQFYNPIPGTDEATVTVTGFRYIVNQPGSGVTIQEVGRVVYDDFSETTWQAIAGQHDLPVGDMVEPAICDALSG